ncbi:MAG: thioredoxin family protein [Deltaproteobacteria bacterium]|nr:thioredoxin family protein [Deltaproteobacteria bacterium]
MRMLLHIPNYYHFVFTILSILLGTIVVSPANATDPRISARAAFHPQEIQPGKHAVLTVEIDVPEGFILYSPVRIPDGPLALQMAPQAPALEPRGPWYGTRPRVKWDDAFEKKVEYYKKRATFERLYAVDTPGRISVPISITGQICDDKSCYNQKTTTTASISVSENAPPANPPATLSGVAFDDSHTPGEITTSTDGNHLTEDSARNRPETIGLLAFLLMAVVAGFGALLTPCVFPMIPITISFFSKNQNLSSRTSLFLAAVYAISIIIVYTIPGVVLSMIFGAGSMQAISTHPAFNVFITMLLIFFGLNLIGLFEIRLPGWLINKSAQKEQSYTGKTPTLRKQIAGVFFMAVTFTLVSFSCTVGFVGGWVLPLAARGDAFYPIVGMLAFSSAFALPFFLLALFPAAATRLQGKGGDWMVAVKVAFGVIELAAAMKFISNLDLHFQWGIVTRDVALWVWVVAFLQGALIVLKVYQRRKPANTGPGIVRIVLAVILIGFAAKSYSGTGNSNPMGGWIDGWLPPLPYPLSVDEQSDTISGGHLPFLKDNLNNAMATAREQKRPLFVDFTGFQCANCRQMESNIFVRPEVKTRLQEMVRVKLYTDGPKTVHQQQREYQFERFNTAVLPFYVIVNPFDDTVLATFSSMTNSEADFIRFLDKGLFAFRQIKTSTADTPKPTAKELVNSKVEDMPEIHLLRRGIPFKFDLPLLLTDGRATEERILGKWTLVNFWASYCAPCKKELNRDIPEALKKHPDIQFVSIAVEPEETVSSAKAFLKRVELEQYTHLLAPEDWPEETLPKEIQKYFALPSSLLLNPEGEIIWAQKGSIDEQLLLTLFNQIIKR